MGNGHVKYDIIVVGGERHGCELLLLVRVWAAGHCVLFSEASIALMACNP